MLCSEHHIISTSRANSHTSRCCIDIRPRYYDLRVSTMMRHGRTERSAHQQVLCQNFRTDLTSTGRVQICGEQSYTRSRKELVGRLDHVTLALFKADVAVAGDMNFVVHFSKEWKIKSNCRGLFEVNLGGFVIVKVELLSFECRDEKTASGNWQIAQDCCLQGGPARRITGPQGRKRG